MSSGDRALVKALSHHAHIFKAVGLSVEILPPKSPFITSGLRIGTPAVTSRGMKEAEMRLIGSWIASVIKDIKNEKNIRDVHGKVEALAGKFTLYPE